MNVAGGASFTTPYWQTEDLRLGILGEPLASNADYRHVVLSCGTRVVASCSARFTEVGGEVQVRRDSGVWHVGAASCRDLS